MCVYFKTGSVKHKPRLLQHELRGVRAEGKSLGAELLGNEPRGSKRNGNMHDLGSYREGDGFSIALGRARVQLPLLVIFAVEKVCLRRTCLVVVEVGVWLQCC